MPLSGSCMVVQPPTLRPTSQMPCAMWASPWRASLLSLRGCAALQLPLHFRQLRCLLRLLLRWVARFPLVRALLPLISIQSYSSSITLCAQQRPSTFPVEGPDGDRLPDGPGVAGCEMSQSVPSMAGPPNSTGVGSDRHCVVCFMPRLVLGQLSWEGSVFMHGPLLGPETPFTRPGAEIMGGAMTQLPVLSAASFYAGAERSFPVVPATVQGALVVVSCCGLGPSLPDGSWSLYQRAVWWRRCGDPARARRQSSGV